LRFTPRLLAAAVEEGQILTDPGARRYMLETLDQAQECSAALVGRVTPLDSRRGQPERPAG